MTVPGKTLSGAGPAGVPGGRDAGRRRERDRVRPDRDRDRRPGRVLRPDHGEQLQAALAGDPPVGADPPPEQVRPADEPRDERGGRALVDLGRRADLLDPARVHHGDAVGGHHGLGLVVGHVDGRDLQGLVDPPDLEPHLLPEVGVEVRERLVQEEDRGLHDEGPRERDALLLTAGELPRVAVGEPLEPHERERLPEPSGPLRPGHVAELEPVGHVLRHRLVRPDRVRLEEHAHPAALGRHGLARRREAPVAEPDLPGVGGEEARDEAEGRGLPAAGGAEERHELPVADLEREIPDGGDVLAVPLGERQQADPGHAAGQVWRKRRPRNRCATATRASVSPSSRIPRADTASQRPSS